MNTKLGCLVGLMMMAAGVVGCGGSDNTPKYTCEASMTASTDDYTVTGSTMTLTNPDPSVSGSLVVSRLSPGTSSGFDAYGVWQLPAQTPIDGITLDGTIEIEASSIVFTSNCTSPSSTGKAVAMSPVTVTADSIKILVGQDVVTTF
jgi:hypothetical protein